MITPELPTHMLRADSRAEGRAIPGRPKESGEPPTRLISGDTWAFSGQRYEALLASTKDYVFEVTLHSGKPVATRHGCGCEAVTGFTSQEFNADASLWYRMIHLDDRPAVLEQVARLFQGEVPGPLEHRILHKDGSTRWIRNAIVPQCDPEGHLVAYLGLISDITPRKRAEEFAAVQMELTRHLERADVLDEALRRILESLCVRLSWDWAAFWGSGETPEALGWSGLWYARTPEFDSFAKANAEMRFTSSACLPGRARASGQPVWIPDLARDASFTRGAAAERVGLHSGWAFPIHRREDLVGVVELMSAQPRLPDPPLMQLATAVALQIGQSLDRIKAYEMLTTERNLLRVLVDTLPDYVFAKDIHGRFMMSNAAHAAVLGVTRPQDAVGKTDIDFFPRGLARRYRRDDEALLRTGTPLINREEPVVNRSGLRQWVLTTKVPWRDVHGGMVGLVGVSRDITERKRSEESVKLSEARLQSILDNASAIVYLKDLDGRYLLVNRKFEALTGLPREKTVGGTDLDLFPDALARRFRAHDAQVLSSLTAIEFEEEAPQPDGLHTFLSVKFPLLNSAGRAYAVCGMSTDISERKREEENLRQAHAELRQSEASLKRTLKQLEDTHAELKATELQLIHAAKLECVGTLAAGVAHEVKNPLQTLIMGLDYLALHLPTQQEGVESVLGDMRYAVQRANAIISGLLELSTTTTSHARPEDLNACVERSLALLDYDMMANQTVICRQFDPGLPPVPLDRGQMEQVLLNLFINALHAMPHGGQLLVRTRTLPAEEVQAFPERISRPFHRGDSLVAVEIQDTGTGIPEAILPRIFDPFFTTKPVGQGTGLGLAVVRRIVDLHGGSIDIRNAPAHGVRATLILKAVPSS